MKILEFVAAQTQAQEPSQREALSLWSHLRQILHLISLVKISCWHSVVQGDGKAVSSSHQNTAVSTDDTAEANQPTNKTGLQLAVSLCFYFFCPLVHSDQLLLQKGLVNWARRCSPQDRWDSVQCWAVQLSHVLMPAGSSAKVCREMTLHLPEAAPATPPTDQGIWHRNVTAYCILCCVFLLGVLSFSSKSQMQVTLMNQSLARESTVPTWAADESCEFTMRKNEYLVINAEK